MTDEEIEKAFTGAPLGAGILIACGYAFMLTRASSSEVAVFTLGILAIALNGLLVEHAMRHGKWWAFPSFLFAIACAFAGVFAIILSMAPYLPE